MDNFIQWINPNPTDEIGMFVLDNELILSTGMGFHIRWIKLSTFRKAQLFCICLVVFYLKMLVIMGVIVR